MKEWKEWKSFGRAFLALWAISWFVAIWCTQYWIQLGATGLFSMILAHVFYSLDGQL